MDYTPRERISKETGMAMIFVASAFWLISFIPFANYVAIPSGWIIIWMWFKTRGASLGKKKAHNITSLLVGLVPFIGPIISAFPFVVYINIREIQKEDAAYNKSQQKTFSQNRR